MTQALAWLRARPGRVNAAGWLACGLLAALFLAPAIAAGAFGPGDLLLTMTPWSAYRDRFTGIQGVANPQLDVIQQYFPWRIYASEQLRAGILPLWNPHAYCGQPFVGNVLSAVFYPFCWLAVAMRIGGFFLLSAWCHLTLLGGGLWLLLRAHRLRWFSALGGAGVMMLNGFVVGWLAYAPLSQWTFAWAPLLLWSWQRAWQAQRPGGLTFTALILAVTVLGGHVQIAFAVGLAWALYAGGTLLAERRWRELGRWLLLPALLGGLLAALQLLPAYEMAGLSGRTGQDYAAAMASRLPASMAVCLLVPHFFGHNALHLTAYAGGVSLPVSFWGPFPNAVEASVSAGATALWLSLAALLWRRDRPVRLFGLIGLVGLLLGFGTPVYQLAYHLVPGFSSLSGLGRWFCLWCLAAAALSGFGIEALTAAPLERPCPKRTGLLMVAGSVVWLLIAFGLEAATEGRLTAFTPGLGGFVVGRCGVALAATLAVGHVCFRRARRLAPWLGLVAVGELFWLGFRMHPGTDPEVFFFATPETEWLQEHAGTARVIGVPVDPERGFLDWFPQNTPMAFGLSSPSGSESLSFAAYRELLAEFCEPGWQPRLDSPLLDLIGARYAVSRADLSEFAWRRVAGERVGIWENDRALPVLFATTRWERLPAEQVLDRLLAPGFDPRVVVVPPAAPPSQTVISERISLDVQRLTPQRWIATAATDVPAMMVLTTPTSVGWSAYGGDGERPILPADGVFGAVLVEPGAGAVRWVYQPAAFSVGLFLSLLALAATTAWGAAGRETREP